MCGLYVDEIIKKYNPEYNMFLLSQDINEQLKPVYEHGTPEDIVILLVFMNDESDFDETDLPYFEKAITKLKKENRIHNNIKKHLMSYMEVLKEHKFIKTKYVGSFAAMAICKS